MDVKFSISFSINKLENLLGDGASTGEKASLQKQVQAALVNLHASKKLLKDVDDFDKASVDFRKISQLLRSLYSAEDAIDTFTMSRESLRIIKSRNDCRSHNVSFASELQSCCFTWQGRLFDLHKFNDVMKYYCRRVLHVHDMKLFCSQIRFTRKMKKFNGEFRHLVEKIEAETCDVQNSNNDELSFQDGAGQCSLSDFCLEEETHFVDFQQQASKLVARLIPRVYCNDGPSRSCNEIIQEVDAETESNESTNQVIAVVGEVGIGKTALVRSVYNRLDVRRQFTHRAWVRIQSGYRARDVLADILGQISEPELVPLTMHSEDALMLRLTKLLKMTRFLIVLEDVDALQQVIWKHIQQIVSSTSQCGNFIVTAESRYSLSTEMVAFSTFEICRLTPDESWRLFSMKVRMTEDELDKTELIGLKEPILKMCGGLPSAVVLLGGLLSTKKRSYGEWSRVISLAHETYGGILGLSYEDLMLIVKPCFLYMGIFPRGFEIPTRRLIHLWCAEGFVTPSDSEERDPEDVAEMCFAELVTRNMVQVTWRLDGTPKTCCMPSVLYDFFSSKAENYGFLCRHFVPSHTSLEQQKFAVRRLAAYTGTDYSSSFRRIKNLRSYMGFDKRVRITPSRDIEMLLNKIISSRGFGLLKVLNLEGVYKPILSNNVVVKLLQLSYLGLRSTFINDLPDGFRYLSWLETLDVKHTEIGLIRLPESQNLRHIYLNRHVYVSFSDAQTNLRTLWGLHISDPYVPEASKIYFRVLFNMKKLTKLGLTLSIAADQLRNLAKWVRELTELQSLKLRFVDAHDQAASIELESMIEHHKLQELYLLGSLPQYAMNVGFLPPNLRKLTLSVSKLEVDPMPVLAQLPHLNILRLFSDSYTGTTMTCSSQGFPKLHLLKLWNLPVKEWIVEEGTMPCLKELEIRSCKSLEVPKGLQYVITLKELVLTNMPWDFGKAVEGSLRGIGVCIRNNTWISDPFKFWVDHKAYET